MQQHLSAAVTAIALDSGAAACGVIPVQDIREHKRYLEAVSNEPPGLAYLRRNPSVRANIGNWFGPARSVLVCVFQYWHSGRDYGEIRLKARTGEGGGKISRYALVPDYHKILGGKLKAILAAIKAAVPEAGGKIFVDTSPVMEKELGRLAGLGFRGKNTLLVSEELGSYFFIGGMALNFDSGPASSQISKAGCGDCRRCIAACPTGALSEPGVLRPELCVSYWTTQSKEKMPETLAAKNAGFVYGCDLCQEACPRNAVTVDKVLKEFREDRRPLRAGDLKRRGG